MWRLYAVRRIDKFIAGNESRSVTDRVCCCAQVFELSYHMQTFPERLSLLQLCRICGSQHTGYFGFPLQ